MCVLKAASFSRFINVKAKQFGPLHPVKVLIKTDFVVTSSFICIETDADEIKLFEMLSSSLNLKEIGSSFQLKPSKSYQLRCLLEESFLLRSISS